MFINGKSGDFFFFLKIKVDFFSFFAKHLADNLINYNKY